MADCIYYKAPVIDPMNQKITMTVKEYLELTPNKYLKMTAKPDIHIKISELMAEIKVPKSNEVINTIEEQAKGYPTTVNQSKYTIHQENIQKEYQQIKDTKKYFNVLDFNSPITYTKGNLNF
jgi:hypothetical protein